jgi:hypothetical protein
LQLGACKSEAVTKSSRLSNKLLTFVPEAAQKKEVETAAPLPIITVVYTIGGPVVCQRLSNQHMLGMHSLRAGCSGGV